MGRLLVVDWDYFFEMKHHPNPQWPLYDWGHSEAWPTRMANFVWLQRAAAFMLNGLPLPGTTGLEATFWDRFTFAPNARLFVSDSNMWTGSTQVATSMEFVDTLWLFDAHHDAGYKPGAYERVSEEMDVSCEDWMIVYDLMGTELHMRYPRWHRSAFSTDPVPEFEFDRAFDDERPVPEPFDAVHVCRSGAWTPPWIDKQFLAFLDACPIRDRRDLEDVDDRNSEQMVLQAANLAALEERVRNGDIEALKEATA